MSKICISILTILVALVGIASAELNWSIQTVDSSDHVGSANSITLDLGGNPYIIYRSDPNNGYLKYARWTGGTWFIGYMAQKGAEPSTITDSSGNTHVSYRDYNSHDVIHAKWNGNGWDKEIADSAGAVGSFSSIAIDSHGYPYITYYDETNGNGDLKYAKWTGTRWDTQTIRGSLDYDEGRGTSIVIDSNDNPHVVFVDFATGGAATNFNLKYMRWTGSGWSSPQTIESGFSNLPKPSLAIDRFDNLHIVYGSQGNLKYAKLVNNVWNMEIIESNAGSEGNRRLSVDSTGNPHISYFKYAGTSSGVKYAKRDTDSWHTQVVDTTGCGGGSTSIVLDSFDSPYISYYDCGTYNLKYAKGTVVNEGDVVIRKGGASISIVPRINNVISGNSVTPSIKIKNTQNVDDRFRVYINNDGIPVASQSNLGWFNWTEKFVNIRAGQEMVIPLSITPIGAGTKAFKARANSTISTKVYAYNVGYLNIT